MKYNFIKELYRGSFSLSEDMEQTKEDISDIYKRIGLESLLVKIQSITHSQLTDNERLLVQTGYLSTIVLEAIAGISMLYGDIRDAQYFAIMGTCLGGGTFLHNISGEHNRDTPNS